MLIEFSVGNYLSFKDIVTFSMEAAAISEHEESNVFFFDKYKLLKSAVVYGANASGKSNFINAMASMKWIVLNSSKETQATDQMPVYNFSLSTETDNKPSFFEVVFICDQKKFRYGFEIDKDRVYSEWLFFTPSRREVRLFIRNVDDIKINPTHFKEGKGLEKRTRPNALFLSVVAQFNGSIAQKILVWFYVFMIISGLDDKTFMGVTAAQLENEDFRQKLLKYLKIADLGIDDISMEKKFELSESMKDLLISEDGDFGEVYDISIFHHKYDDKHEKLASKVKFNLGYESEGTQKFFGILGPILAFLGVGLSTLVIDELDARLHPFITRFIIELFHSKQTNPNNAQLIFATHDTNLLTNKLFRRDQIWFTEKDQYGATDLYSLVEYKNVRKDAIYEKDYIAGKYGAVPFIKNFEVLLGDE
jgi:hypothetical protein